MDPIISELLPAIEEQIASTETTYVLQTYNRLTALTDEDVSESEAKQMIAFCLADELDKMSSDNRPFSSERYKMLLELLPVLPES